MVPLIYSPAYDITAFGLEKLHPFDSRKYRRIRDWLVRQGLRLPDDFVSPPECSRDDLLRLHPADYLAVLRRPSMLAQYLGLPLLALVPAFLTDWRVLKPMRWATGGTVFACKTALEEGLAINLAGGYHHASAHNGGGFCVYADVPLALTILKAEGKINSALVVDTDAHQGDGTATAIRTWAWAHILDFYEEDIFPWPKVDEDVAVPLPAGTQGAEYLALLDEHLPQALDRYRPDLVVYNAGSDVLETDPLARLRLTPAELAERDLCVVSSVRERNIPVAMVLSGGYGPLSWEAHARSIEGLLARFDRRA